MKLSINTLKIFLISISCTVSLNATSQETEVTPNEQGVPPVEQVVAADEQDYYAKTKYPVILIHGFLGSEHLTGVDYFFGIVPALRENGATVYAPAVSAVNSTEVRGEQLRLFLKGLQAQHGYTKFNLIGHSHGGLSARYVMGVEPDMVASITTIGTPNDGSFPSDIELSSPFFRIFDWVFALVGKISNGLDGHKLPQDKLAYLNSTSTAGVREFNARFPDGVTNGCNPQVMGKNPSNILQAPPQSIVQTQDGFADVPQEVQATTHLYSMGGVGGKTGQLTTWIDPTDWWMQAQAIFSREQNDGWINRCSTHFGTVIRDDFAWNHLDEINQLFGLVAKKADSPVAVYLNHVNRLKQSGL